MITGPLEASNHSRAETTRRKNRNIPRMAEQEPPAFNQDENGASHLARYSEYRPGEQAPYFNRDGQLVKGKVLHVSNRTDGQLYLIESERGFPDVVLASEITEKEF